MTTTTISATHTTITTPNSNPEKPIISIRQICLQGFLAQRSRKEIAEEIVRHHPTSAAASKSAKHIAWHYGDMKKRGLLASILEVGASE